jgi:hypothetical protein
MAGIWAPVLSLKEGITVILEEGRVVRHMESRPPYKCIAALRSSYLPGALGLVGMRLIGSGSYHPEAAADQ